MRDVIHCIGDSHASFFSGRNSIQNAWPNQARDTIPLFRSYRLGAVLAYSLPDLHTKSEGREKLLELLKTLPKGSRILMNFGEIDCRVHLIKQAQMQGREIESVVYECVERYFSVIKEISKGFELYAWAVVPSTLAESSVDPRYPHVGTNLERNHVTRLFNESLEKMCREVGIGFISIFEQLVDRDGRTLGKYFGDRVHLSQKAMPLALRKIESEIPGLNFRLFEEPFGKVPSGIQKTLFAIKSEGSAFFYFSYKKLRALARRIIRGT